jgi:hypothetical protein
LRRAIGQGEPKTTSLLFNWNAGGFSEIARVGNQDAPAVSRTGAPRILYRPAAGLSDLDEPKAAEDPKEAAAQEDAAQKAPDAND